MSGARPRSSSAAARPSSAGTVTTRGAAALQSNDSIEPAGAQPASARGAPRPGAANGRHSDGGGRGAATQSAAVGPFQEDGGDGQVPRCERPRDRLAMGRAVGQQHDPRHCPLVLSSSGTPAMIPSPWRLPGGATASAYLRDAQPLRVVHLNDLANTGTVLVAALREAGVDARLIDPARHGRWMRYPWKLGALPLRAAALVQAALRARRAHADLVHVHYARQGWMGPVSRAPFLVHCHGTDVRGIRPQSAWGRAVQPWLRRARRVVYATPDLEPWVKAFRTDAVFVPNPIAVHPQPEPDGPMVDLFVGVRFDHVKGADAVIATLQHLRRIRPETSMTVVEQGTERVRALEAIGDGVRGDQLRAAPTDAAALRPPPDGNGPDGGWGAGQLRAGGHGGWRARRPLPGASRMPMTRRRRWWWRMSPRPQPSGSRPCSRTRRRASAWGAGPALDRGAARHLRCGRAGDRALPRGAG